MVKWKTRHLEGVVPGRAGSTPASDTPRGVTQLEECRSYKAVVASSSLAFPMGRSGEMEDTHGLGPCALVRAGSNPVSGM